MNSSGLLGDFLSTAEELQGDHKEYKDTVKECLSEINVS